MQQITPEQARAELERRRATGVQSAQITPEQARAELARRRGEAAPPSEPGRRRGNWLPGMPSGGDVRRDALNLISDPLGTMVTGAARMVDRATRMDGSPAEILADEMPAAQMAFQGSTLGFGDEVMGGTAALAAGATGNDPGAAYRENTDAAREGLARNREEAPVTSFLLEIAGGGATGAGVAGSLSRRFPGMTRQMLNFASRHPYLMSALTAGGSGAVVGIGEGDDHGRLESGLQGGTLGLFMGPAVRGATGLGGRLYGSLRNRNVSRGTQAAERAGLTVDDVTALDGDFLAETAQNPRAQSTAIGLAGMGDDAQAVIRDAVSERQAGRAQRLADAVEGSTGSRGGAGALLQLDEIRAQARPLFNAADDVQGRMTPRLREMVRQANRAGVTFRNADELAARDGDARVALSAFADDADGLPDQIRLGDVRALARAVENEARRLSRQGENPGSLWNLAREMRDQISRQSPEYRQAAQMWRSSARDEEAFELGQRAFRPGAQQERALRRFFANGSRSQSEQRNFLAGVADAMDQRISGAAETGNPAARLNRAIVRDRLKIVLGDEAGDELMNTIMRENRRASFENVASREVNSSTDARQQGRRDAQAALMGAGRQFAGDLVEDTSGTLMARHRLAGAVRGDDPEAAADLARLLMATSRSDPAVQRFLSEMDSVYRASQGPAPVADVLAGQGAGFFLSGS